MSECKWAGGLVDLQMHSDYVTCKTQLDNVAKPTTPGTTSLEQMKVTVKEKGERAMQGYLQQSMWHQLTLEHAFG